MYDKGFIWNPSNCECECDKLCDIGEYLDYKNCKCRKRIIDKLVEECSKNIYELVEECSKNIYENETLDIIPLNAIPLNVYKKVCNSWMVYIYSIICYIFNNKHMHLQCFYLLSLVF